MGVVAAENRGGGGGGAKKESQGFSPHGTPFPPLGRGDKQTRFSVRERARRIPPEPAWAVQPTCVTVLCF